MVKLHDKLSSNFDLIPPGASPPLIKPRSIDDVPILALTLWSERVDPLMLRRIAAQLDDRVKAVPEVSETRLIGGLRRQLRVTLDRDRLAGFGVAPGSVLAALGEANRALRVGSFARGNHEYLVDAGAFVATALGAGRARHRRLARPARVPERRGLRRRRARGTARVRADDGRRPRPPDGPAGQAMPAVTLSVAKRKGTNAVVIAERVLAQVEAARAGPDPGRRARHGDAQLRGDGAREVQRAAEASLARDAVGDGADRALPRHPRLAGGADRHSRDAGAHAVPVLSLRLHAEPRDALRAHLLHRHPRGRRHRGGGEHRPPLPPAGRTAGARARPSPSRRWTRSAIPPSSPPSR